MAKKFQLSELKVTSFVTSLNNGEQKTAKGGFLGARRAILNNRAFRYADWTQEKTFVKVDLGVTGLNNGAGSKLRG